VNAHSPFSAAGSTTTLGVPYDGRQTVRARSVDVSGKVSALPVAVLGLR